MALLQSSDWQSVRLTGASCQELLTGGPPARRLPRRGALRFPDVVFDFFATRQRPTGARRGAVNPGPGERPGPRFRPDYVAKFYTTVFAHPATAALTWWDFSGRGAWQRAAAGVVRKDMSPKPVCDRLQALLKGAWWTRVQGRTNERGEWAVRAFFVTPRVTAELDIGRELEKEVSWQRRTPNRFELIAA